ncbi:NAD(P)/FAD-dependent oxidoreductase [Pseudoalteromonas sp. MMG012]|uniref:NAD(P)/FAD-dependent oxidoreductase n=1 Tax=Pseudoalteromonas sp. MMG012 TaxID=2822686 RepID=UPI001B3A5B99|nr:NAD(P)/FAD-dependent oxidoreductase [Pseudoalteromonas sp. MMG012]MBQ4851671.1 NAD(P)/FAD-dependent oxidoreductase [Pseudoalteromonas sp. MMG012]
MEKLDTVVIGAGVIGMAVAAKFSESTQTLLIEQGEQFGEHSSSRNSEVIHAGLYYATNSLKAQLCIQGKELLYRHCEKFHVPHKRIGKVLTAKTTSEVNTLHTIAAQAKINGVDDLQFLSKTHIGRYAPHINATHGLWSPSTGIIDSHQFMLSLLTKLTQNHGQYVPRTQFLAARKTCKGYIVDLDCDGDLFQIQCQYLINAGGLFAQKNASLIDGLEKKYIPELHYCRGQYFSYHGKHPFSHLVYPVPEKHGLGIHATLNLAGQLRFGPDTHFIHDLNYQVDANDKNKFVQAIKQYWPAIDDTKLFADYAGIRPKITQTGAQDFIIQSSNTHGYTGLINLFGIESPGLTASLAIAEQVLKDIG